MRTSYGLEAIYNIGRAILDELTFRLFYGLFHVLVQMSQTFFTFLEDIIHDVFELTCFAYPSLFYCLWDVIYAEICFVYLLNFEESSKWVTVHKSQSG